MPLPQILFMPPSHATLALGTNISGLAVFPTTCECTTSDQITDHIMLMLSNTIKLPPVKLQNLDDNTIHWLARIFCLSNNDSLTSQTTKIVCYVVKHPASCYSSLVHYFSMHIYKKNVEYGNV